MSDFSVNPSVEQALYSVSETAKIEFKSSFDMASGRDWCEIVKDIVAISNSGGGTIIIGLDDNGSPSHFDISPLLNLDPAQVTDKIHKYTGYQFNQFVIVTREKLGSRLLALDIFETPIPIVFEKPGTYEVGGGQQQSAFRKGTLFFRHGAKSEPADNDDLRASFERRLDEARNELLKNVRTVVEAPAGSTFMTVVPSADETALPVRISNNLSDPVVGRIDPDQTHPYRLKELVQSVNRKLPPAAQVNQYDIQAVRKVHDTDATFSFHYHGKYSSHQYSEAFVNWLADQYRRDPAFFQDSRARYLQVKRGFQDSA